MVGHLYRYPHPLDSSKFIYVGQGAKRDQEHRSGKSSFGRRFKRDFPDYQLPQPVCVMIEVENQLELSEHETIWIFQYHTWHGMGGMNLRLPEDKNWKSTGRMGGENQQRKYKVLGGFNQKREDKVRGGISSGRIAAESGRCARIARLGGEQSSHNYWHVRRGIVKQDCKLCQQ